MHCVKESHSEKTVNKFELRNTRLFQIYIILICLDAGISLIVESVDYVYTVESEYLFAFKVNNK
jgi:hypothetical protein